MVPIKVSKILRLFPPHPVYSLKPRTMKRFHVHLKVTDLARSIDFYQALFAAPPTVTKTDYAKWQLDDPKVNFAISTTQTAAGIEHLGIQVDSPEELHEVYGRMVTARGEVYEEGHTTCCYARSEKAWISDPQGVEWEAFHTYGGATVYGEGHAPRRPGLTEFGSSAEGTSGGGKACCG